MADISQTTASRVAHGDHKPEPETVTALAQALRVLESTRYRLTHEQGITTRHWEPPTELYRLSKRSQDAVTEIIRALASEQDQKEAMANAHSTVPINYAGRSATAEPTQEAASSDDDGIEQDELPHDT